MTLIIVALTAIVSIAAFNNRQIFYKLLLNPFQVYHRKEWYRLFSHGLIHADWTHLIINMIVLWSFGSSVEYYLDSNFLFLLLYVSAILISTSNTIRKYKDNANYDSVGASGGVSAIVFASIYFDPFRNIYFYFAIPIPGIVFAALYLGYSYYMSKKNSDNINHDSHFIGAVIGIIFPFILGY
ncbi:MAG: rhomboid family intramembrane serine protease [Bacteroidetes bacterium]|jgi:membrane associated rhomboid family serine protease|nr:rhomboid family intramembrane serine protease [Bacteroidota bacterium]MBT4968108.1 rhomboid family intramembrane serine protease [Bacteroidota bacterium]MBT6685862.1 rhomboid family intramembrane serine protease [Bacteroidota bacterium]MBT7144074.1 rhomboid family intramembrane serine protease [Bacteroidota bacterium]MBT7490996.1 rhomboid family intramembrane serine protease [Bacteroidota bacterium]